MKNIFKHLYILFGVVLLVSACKKDKYFVGGDLHNPNVNMTTYDFLKSNERGLFDTLIMIIDAAELKDRINEPGITFFAPTDYSINNYVEARTRVEQNIDPFRMWTVDSIIKYELPQFKDSLERYIISERVNYQDVTENGVRFSTAGGDECIVSYEATDDPNFGYNPNSSHWPRIMYFTYLYQPLEEDIKASEVSGSMGARTRVQTSGIESTTGMIHVLNNGHRLFFFR